VADNIPDGFLDGAAVDVVLVTDVSVRACGNDLKRKKKLKNRYHHCRVCKNNKVKNWSEEKLMANTENFCSELVVEYDI